MHERIFKTVKRINNGTIKLDACLHEGRDGQYINTQIFFDELARVSKPLFLTEDITPCFQLLHMGGAFMSNEQYTTYVNVHDQASLILTTQSSGKVQVTKPKALPPEYNIDLTIGENARLEFINDSLIMYSDARYIQNVNIHLSKSSTLIYSDILSSGYSYDDKKHPYDDLKILTKVYLDNKLVLYDKLFFKPSDENPHQIGLMNGYSRCGNLLIYHPKLLASDCKEIHDFIKELISFKYQLGISMFVDHFLGVRVLADEIYEVNQILNLIHNLIRKKYLAQSELNLRKLHNI